LSTDERYADVAGRYKNRSALIGELDREFSALSLDEVRAKFVGFSGVWAPVLRPSELHSHPQADSNGFLPWVSLGLGEGEGGAGVGGEGYRIVAAPMHFSGHTTAPTGPAPELGQHTEEVLLEAGLSWEAIGALRDGGGLG
jgi:formyl-CoA transferase